MLDVPSKQGKQFFRLHLNPWSFKNNWVENQFSELLNFSYHSIPWKKKKSSISFSWSYTVFFFRFVSIWWLPLRKKQPTKKTKHKNLAAIKIKLYSNIQIAADKLSVFYNNPLTIFFPIKKLVNVFWLHLSFIDRYSFVSSISKFRNNFQILLLVPWLFW